MKNLKIIDWRKGEIRSGRKGSNQYKSKQKGNAALKIILPLFAVGAIIFGYRAYTADASIFTKVFMGKLPVQDAVQATVQDDLTAEQQANLEKQAELARKEVILNNKKKKLDADYATASAQIESELEAVRKDKLTVFTSAPKQ